jgi:7-keto-8-aminopelargonate synthetase-like enzyme
LARYGLNVASSRTVTGNHPVYQELEEEAARYFGFPCATLSSQGFGAAVVAAQGLAGWTTHALVDERAHGCMKDGAALLGAKVIEFSHGSPESLKRAVRSCGRRAKISVWTDGLAAHEGTVPPLQEYLGLMPEDSFLVVDDAHGTATVGAHGRGVVELLKLQDPRIVLTITFSKALGCYGGAVLGSKELRARIAMQSRIYSSSTPLPLPLVAANLKSLEVATRIGERLRSKLRRNASLVKQAFAATRPEWLKRPGPMFALAPKLVSSQQRLQRMLVEAGIFPTFIRYSSGPADRFFRFSISTVHSRAQLLLLRDVLQHYERMQLP